MVVAFERRPRGDLLTMSEAAVLAGVHRNTIRAWCASGRLPSVQIDARGERRVRRSDVERLMIARVARAELVADEARRARAGRSTGLDADQVETPVARGLDVVGRRPRGVGHPKPTGDDVLRRLAAELSGSQDLPTLFEDVLDDSRAIFSVDRVGLWLYEKAPNPFKLAAQRGLSIEMLEWLASLSVDANAASLQAVRTHSVVVLADGPDLAPAAVERVLYAWCLGAGPLVAASYAGHRGHPIVVGSEVWSSVPDEGLRAFEPVLVPCEDLGAPGDVDTPEDLE